MGEEAERDGPQASVGDFDQPLAAVTIVVPVLARADQVASVLTHDAHVRFCPFCGAPVESSESNVVTCPRCAVSYTVTLDAPGRPVGAPVEPVA